ncbi:MAG: gamma-butyrobetaine hydroxylase-like domain-containing protein [Proteobacteria bacterium]|nr:gamma-butyrobetaine hydroxylase-like domain-containing protein [Pseudomonadota bacterium]
MCTETSPKKLETEAAWPKTITLSEDKALLQVSFSDGYACALAAELLRVEAPSADVQGYGDKQTPAGKRKVTITGVEPVGQYAIRLQFSDGHNTGLFTWETLYRYGKNQAQMIDSYLKRLSELGLSRD